MDYYVFQELDGETLKAGGPYETEEVAKTAKAALEEDNQYPARSFFIDTE